MRLGGLGLFFISWAIAHYRVFITLSEWVSDGADIISELEGTNLFPSDGMIKAPLEYFPHHAEGYDNNGIPDFAIMRTHITLTNRGNKAGILRCVSKDTNITMDSLFDKEQSKCIFDTNDPIQGERTERQCSNGIFLIAEKDPIIFARKLNKLGKEKYKIIIPYWTQRIDGIKKYRKIEIVGTYESFVKEVHKHWGKYGLEKLRAIH